MEHFELLLCVFCSIIVARCDRSTSNSVVLGSCLVIGITPIGIWFVTFLIMLSILTQKGWFGLASVAFIQMVITFKCTFDFLHKKLLIHSVVNLNLRFLILLQILFNLFSWNATIAATIGGLFSTAATTCSLWSSKIDATSTTTTASSSPTAAAATTTSLCGATTAATTISSTTRCSSPSA